MSRSFKKFIVEYYDYFPFEYVVDKEVDNEKRDKDSERYEKNYDTEYQTREDERSEEYYKNTDDIENDDDEQDYNPARFRQWMEFSIAGDS